MILILFLIFIIIVLIKKIIDVLRFCTIEKFDKKDIVKYDISKLDYDTFQMLINGKNPIIFTHFISKDDLEKITFSNFCKNLPDKNIIVRYGDYGSTNGRKERKYRNDNLHNFCNNIDNSSDYGGNNRISADEFTLLGIKPNCTFLEKFPGASLWIGPKDSRTPLHKDGPKNLALQLYGDKKWIIYNSNDVPKLCYPYNNNGLEWSQYNVNDLTTCNEAKNTEPYNIIMNPGELLYLPSQWSHDVTNLTKSIMVNFWFHDFKVFLQDNL